MKRHYAKLPVLALAVSALASSQLWASGTVEQLVTSSGHKAHAIQLVGPGQYRLVGDGPLKAIKNKASQDLMALHEEYQIFLKLSKAKGLTAQTFKTSNSLAPIAADSVTIDATASGDPKTLADELRGLGAQKITIFGRLVSARLPLSTISNLNTLTSLQFARPAYAVHNVGTVTSQGDAAMRANIARTTVGVNGAGVMVGTLSDSYNCLGGAAAGVASGDLPPGVNILEEEFGCASGSDEGRAMMEIIHDVAPGASQSFHTAFNGQANFAQGIIDLANAGAKVINDDVIYFAEPFYQDGIVAQAVDTVKSQGVAYFSAAGNSGRNAYEAPFRPSGFFIDLGAGPEEAHDFKPGPGVDICQKITMPSGSTLFLDFQWDQPFFTVSGSPGSASDLDLVFTDANCTSGQGFVFATFNEGDDPIELAGPITNSGTTASFGLMIFHFSGPKAGLMKMINMGSSSITFDQFNTKSGTTFGHSAARGGLGVGAANYRDTPEFGTRRPIIEPYSSAGGSPILFNTVGNRLATAEIRQQPAITAPDDVDTSFFFPGFDSDGNGFPNFPGTSAAAPHAAGVAALLKDLVPSLTPDNLYTTLKTTAIDMNDPKKPGPDKGFDFGTGFGLVQADSALIHDLAVVKISAPATVKGTAPVTKTVNVTIQNRSLHSETISAQNLGNGISTGLVRLNVNVVDDDSEGCAAAAIALDSARTLPKGSKVVKPKKSLTVKYLVTYDCIGAKKNSADDLTRGDYSHEASVHHAVLYGIPDSHADDDICPRSVTPPFELDPNPDASIKDKGCGAKKPDNTFGNPVLTNVVGSL